MYLNKRRRKPSSHYRTYVIQIPEHCIIEYDPAIPINKPVVVYEDPVSFIRPYDSNPYQTRLWAAAPMITEVKVNPAYKRPHPQQLISPTYRLKWTIRALTPNS